MVGSWWPGNQIEEQGQWEDQGPEEGSGKSDTPLTSLLDYNKLTPDCVMTLCVRVRVCTQISVCVCVC